MEPVVQFFAMGGYGAYVWPVYGVALVVVGGIAVSSMASLRKAERQMQALQAGGAVRRGRIASAAEDPQP